MRHGNLTLWLLALLLMLMMSACAADSAEVESDGDQSADGDSVADGDDTDGDVADGDTDGDEPDGDFDGDGDTDDEGETEEEPGWPALADEAGYIDIEPIDYYMQSGSSVKDLTSSACKLWYVFQPANEDADNKPLAVFFNGGPGSSTGLLFGFNTARTTLDPAYTTQDAPVADSPAQWTELFNVIYIDARQTGFSYCTMDNVQSQNARGKEFTGRNFNSFFDGADFVRLVLRFLAAHPQLQNNPVVIAGESYGGIRSTVMLHQLLFYPRYADDRIVYQDPQLAAEIQAHYDVVFPELAGQVVPPEIAATQFSHQVLVQPLLSGVYQDEVAARIWEQPGSVMFQVADEEGLTYTPCPPDDTDDCDPYNNALMFLIYEAERDIYNYTEEYGWLFGLGDDVTRKLLVPEILSEAVGMDVTTIDALYAENRADAYRIIDPEADWASKMLSPSVENERRFELLPFVERVLWEQRGRLPYSPDLTTGQMQDVFGTLEPWDRYYLSSHSIVNLTFHVSDLMTYEVEPYNSLYGELFLENLLYVKTFITHAAYDLIIYGPALAEALALHDKVVSGTQWEQSPAENEARGGWITVDYAPGAFGFEQAQSRSFRFPLYPESCHAVEVTEPVEFLDDVRQWWEGETE
jgi:hypothetical protein